MDYQNIITIESGKRSGKPCIRGMRITVYDILEYLAGGMTEAEMEHQALVRRVFDPRSKWNPTKVLPAGARCGELRRVPEGAWV